MSITTTKINLPLILENILNDLIKAGIRPVLVGGCVRDHFLKIPCKDFDIELFGENDLIKIENILNKFGNVKHVGKSFGVLILKVNKYDFDFALPRTEIKIGNLHKDFKVISDVNLTYKEAAIRRDFTINSIGFDFKNKKILDPFDGINDIKNKILRYIDKKSFLEDSLRVYRALQFCARFDLNIDEGTKKLCKKIVDSNECNYLPKERIFEEFRKLFLKSSKPSIGFELLKEFNLLKYFPELESLVNCIQDKEYHPEGDVWVHTLMSIDEMAKILKDKDFDDYRKLYLFYGILCHDLGKPFCTKEIKGRITSHKHESLGLKPTISFLSRLTDEKKFIEKITPLVKNHLVPFQLFKSESSLKAIKRLSLKCNIEDLCLVCLADCKGRTIPNKEKCDKAVKWVLEKAKELDISRTALKPLVQGKDLIQLGLKPSKEFKDILSFALNLQIDEDLGKDKILEEIKKRFF